MDVLQAIRTRAKTACKTIVLPESTDNRILCAAQCLVEQGIAKPLLLANQRTLIPQAKQAGVSLEGIDVIDQSQFLDHSDLAKLLKQIYDAKQRELSAENQQKILNNPLFFATLLVKNKQAHGCIAGAVHTTADVLRAAFSILGTKDNVRSVSGAFLVVINDKVFIFADCAVVVEPTIEQLVDTAIASADSAKTLLNITPKVAMLSFSTHGSGKHALSEKIATATRLIKEKAPDMIIDGELQLDAAINQDVAKLKAPNSAVAGEANVLIFPNLDAANIGYKLVQRLAGAQAIGPILQGIGAPMNDLSRGASVEDIVNMVAITALQSP